MVLDGLEALRTELGSDQVRVDRSELERYQLNVTEYPPRELVAVIQPRDAEQVRRVVQLAAEYRLPLYPISTGKNWGVGSKLPVRGGAAVLDLGSLNRVRWIDEELRTVAVEPGVTQRQLHSVLQAAGSRLVPNVTGAGEQTSLVGNLVERGVGMLGQRQNELRALEVVVGTGEVVRTGHWQAAANGETAFPLPYAPGLGPDLNGLFLQSNLGIVTCAVLGLEPRRHFHLGLLSVADDRLAELVDGLSELRHSGVLPDRIEINADSDPRLRGVIEPSGTAEPATRTWFAWIQLWGDDEVARAARELVCRRFRAMGSVRLFASSAEGPDAVASRVQRLCGEPTNHSLVALAQSGGVAIDPTGDLDLDEQRRVPGFVCCLPAVAFSGKHVQSVVRTADELSAELGVRVDLTFNSVSTSALEGYLRVAFDRREPESVARAHRFNEQLHQELRVRQVLPMRLNIEQMGAFIGGTPFWQVVSTLKKALDPAGIIAPGRYGP